MESTHKFSKDHNLENPEECLLIGTAMDEEAVSITPMNWLRKHRTTILRVLSVLFVVALSLWVFSIRERIKELEAFGYPGIFVISFLANATVIVPAPGLAIVFAMGGIFNPFFVGLAAGAGSGLGEITGYLAGSSGQGITENTQVYKKIYPYVEKYGQFAIFALAAFPNPLFDLAGMAAGVLKMPLRNFLIACILGKTVKCLAFAFAGSYSLYWMSRLIH